MRAVIAAGLLAATAWCGEPPATPGPAARAGAAIDKAFGTVKDEVAAALMVARVRVALIEHFEGDGTRIRIDADGARVELFGAVESRSTQELAGEVAASVTGVREVHSHLTLLSPGSSAGGTATRLVGEARHEVGDALLEAKVKARLIEQLGRVGFSIGVKASGRVVSLSGTVPDAARRKIAEDTAAATSGVSRVIDLLKVGS